MESLDNILARREPASEPEVKQEETTQAATETQAAEQTTEQQTETTDEQQATEGGKQAPIGAIRQAEREKATKRYTEQVADFEKKLAEQNTAWERRFTQLLETVKPKAEPQQPPDWYADPDAATDHRISQRVAPEFDRLNQVMMHNSRLIASQLHTEEAVKAADDAFSQAVASRNIDPADYQRVINSPNIFDAAVRWHKSELAKAEIGPDPAAYKAKLEAELRAKLEAELNGQQTGQAAQNGAAPVFPSNLAAARNVGSRSGPTWGGPAPLGQIIAEHRQQNVFKR